MDQEEKEQQTHVRNKSERKKQKKLSKDYIDTNKKLAENATVSNKMNICGNQTVNNDENPNPNVPNEMIPQLQTLI